MLLVTLSVEIEKKSHHLFWCVQQVPRIKLRISLSIVHFVCLSHLKQTSDTSKNKALQTDGQVDDEPCDPSMAFCFTGTTKIVEAS